MQNTIFLRRQLKVAVTKGNHTLTPVYMATALKNLESLGFTFSQNLIEVLSTLSNEEFVSFYNETVRTLKKMVGAHVAHQPMYVNFPEEVMEMSEAQLYINAIIHYLGSFIRDVTGQSVGEASLPKQEKKERFPLLDRVDLNVIDLGSEEDFYNMIKHLIAAKTSISESDKQDVKNVISSLQDVPRILPEEIALKENVAFVVATLLAEQKASIDDLARYFKTATDVLRLAVALSEGDVSLAQPTRFRKFKRSERRLLLALLERANNPAEDMLRFKGEWIRLGEILHPGEYKAKYKRAYEAFDILRNNKPFQTFNGKVEVALLNKDVDVAISLLSSRPGDFARRLDHVIRMANNPEIVLEAFENVAGNVSTPVLLQVFTHFKHRNDENDLRVIFPKGNVAKATAISNDLPVIKEEICALVVRICERALLARFKELPTLGDTFIDAQLASYIVPFSQRSASKALRTLVRGTKIDFPKGDTIRFFTYWKEGEVNGIDSDRIDIDLSAVMYDANWNYKEHVSYTNLRAKSYKAVHSGDITEAPNGASEFIDIDIPSVVAYGGRYIVATINSFTRQKFSEMPECFAGWMVRENPGSGEIYEPATVVDKVDIAGDTSISIPVILDLVERKVIWCDLALTHHPDHSINIESNQGGMVLMGKAMTNLKKTSLYELFTLHAKARGTIVADKEKAESIFGIHEGITPFDSEKIMAEFLV